ncbi:hypothetical protein DN388_03805 [Pseudomonas sp. S12(2018)]|uniref:hypothetical protein n=1 Tax=Pseudomonas sp. S12(2018) TaxID=2219664 RepID=UPI0020CDAE9E|nr:hypothetical protein [Pseudomonas sp. S12(2018)]MCQ0166073.1 hypothetical protein [Pseudomonas sp. S12(2018)]
MSEISITSGCSIGHLTKHINFEETMDFSFTKEASFTLGAEGFFISCIIALARRKKLGKIKLHLRKTDLEQHGLRDDNYLSSPSMINICIQDVRIYDKSEVDVTDLLTEMVSNTVNMDYGAFEGGQAYSLYALDPYFIHPPILNLGNSEPSEIDFKSALAPRIQECIFGDTAAGRGSLEHITSSMSLYVLLKEVWENTIHHARSTHVSLRYIKVSKVIYTNLHQIQNTEIPEALRKYLEFRFKEDGSKKYLIIDIVDSGTGIYETLKGNLPDLDKAEVVRLAFNKNSTSKIQRPPISRGLGLFSAMECAKKLKGMVIMTTSGTLCVNYDFTEDKFLNETQVFDMNISVDDLSTSLSLIIPA